VSIGRDDVSTACMQRQLLLVLAAWDVRCSISHQSRAQSALVPLSRQLSDNAAPADTADVITLFTTTRTAANQCWPCAQPTTTDELFCPATADVLAR